jgi:hypothetical protein
MAEALGTMHTHRRVMVTIWIYGNKKSDDDD